MMYRFQTFHYFKKRLCMLVVQTQVENNSTTTQDDNTVSSVCVDNSQWASRIFFTERDKTDN